MITWIYLVLPILNLLKNLVTSFLVAFYDTRNVVPIETNIDFQIFLLVRSDNFLITCKINEFANNFDNSTEFSYGNISISLTVYRS